MTGFGGYFDRNMQGSPFISARKALAKNILITRADPNSNKDHDLSQDNVLEIALNQLDNAKKKQVLVLLEQQATNRKGSALTEEEKTQLEQSINQQLAQQLKLFRDDNKKIINNLIAHTQTTTDLYRPLYPIVELILSAKTMPQEELEKYSNSSPIDNFDPKNVTTHTIGLLILVMYYTFYTFSVQIRRGHDLNRSGWLTIIMLFIPVVHFFYFIYLGFFKGTNGFNDYG